MNQVTYRQDRRDWWVSRSQSESHQRAYDNIASQIDMTRADVVVDYGCGNGEMLKRLYQKAITNPQLPLIIGADISEEMLQVASENLENAGIETTITTARDSINHRGVVLVKDDIVDSKLPQSIADVSLLIFPEMNHNEVHLNRLLLEMPELRYAGAATSHHLQYYCLSRIAKIGGRLVLVDYDRREDLRKRGLKVDEGRAEMFNFQKVGNPFFQEEDMLMDLDNIERRKYQRGSTFGYTIFLYRKSSGVEKKFKKRPKRR